MRRTARTSEFPAEAGPYPTVSGLRCPTGQKRNEPVTENTPTDSHPTEEAQDKTFTQADVDKIVKERLTQQARNKYGDYEDLKAKAEGAKTLEDQMADLAAKYGAAEARALRSDIAARHGISAEDRDLFLTGSDEATLEAQAKRLAERDAERKAKGNVAPKEGAVKNTGSADSDARDFTAKLFGRDD